MGLRMFICAGRGIADVYLRGVCGCLYARFSLLRPCPLIMSNCTIFIRFVSFLLWVRFDFYFRTFYRFYSENWFTKLEVFYDCLRQINI